jgi:hypothetical protein
MGTCRPIHNLTPDSQRWARHRTHPKLVDDATAEDRDASSGRELPQQICLACALAPTRLATFMTLLAHEFARNTPVTSCRIIAKRLVAHVALSQAFAHVPLSWQNS